MAEVLGLNRSLELDSNQLKNIKANQRIKPQPILGPELPAGWDL
jgi:hypothetical protein